MEPALVVDLLDEVGKVFGDVLEGFECHQIDRLDLQRFHEALGLGVVIRVSPATHRADQAVGGQCLAVELGSILGRFNRSSQHLELGGCDAVQKSSLGAVHPKQIGFTWAATGMARENLCRFWRAIASGLTSEDAAVDAASYSWMRSAACASSSHAPCSYF
ncbi:hypothetical protein SFGR64A_30485 (plasmid) [Sinorhizobium fredii GR64]|nr:hypothetical protein [Sinorhizobium fredii]WOS67253.1 hypothetical protein SFGR64A_30485 [Sinorhizobium fredii GR64]